MEEYKKYDLTGLSEEEKKKDVISDTLDKSKEIVYVDNRGKTANMTDKERFEHLKSIGLLDRNAKFENWKFETYDLK